MSVVEFREASRRYGRRTVVDRVTLDVASGEILGLLGPNGAGKTTMLRMIAGLTSASSGAVRTFGESVGRGRTPPGIGLVLEESGMVPSMSARKNLRLLSAAGGGGDDIDAALRRVGLPLDNDRPIRSWSQGMRRRLVIAQALLGDPRLLLLDEPTNGLDPGGVVAIRELLQDLRARGVTIVISSHALTEIERLCDRVVFIRSGSIVREIDLLTSPQRLVVTVSAAQDAERVVMLFDGAEVTSSPDHIVGLETEAPTPELVRTMVAHDVDIEGVSRHHDDLERLFLDLVGREL